MFEAKNNKENINLESTIFPSYLIHICELYSCKVCDVMWSIVCFVECSKLWNFGTPYSIIARVSSNEKLHDHPPLDRQYWYQQISWRTYIDTYVEIKWSCHKLGWQRGQEEKLSRINFAVLLVCAFSNKHTSKRYTNEVYYKKEHLKSKKKESSWQPLRAPL